jgi:hypothetical protein
VVTIENVVAVLCRATCYPGVLTYRAAAENPPESSSSTQIFTQDQLNAPNTRQDIFITSTRDFISWGGVLIKIGEGTSVINAPDAQKAVNTELKDWAEFADATPLPSASPK